MTKIYKIRECENLSFLRNIYDENERPGSYVDNIILKSDRSNVVKLRICAHNLEIKLKKAAIFK